MAYKKRSVRMRDGNAKLFLTESLKEAVIRLDCQIG